MTHGPRTRGALALVVGALLSVLTGCSSEALPGQQVDGARTGVLLIDEDARQFAPLDVAAPVLGGDGDELRLADLVGEVVVVNFWGSWCPPCRVEQPDLNAASEALAGDGVRFLGVDVDEASEANGLAHEREFQIPYPSVYDPDSSYTARFGGIGALVMPTTLVLDREGRVAVRLIGETDLIEVVSSVQAVLEDPGTAPG